MTTTHSPRPLGRCESWQTWDKPAKITWRSLDSAIRLWKLDQLAPIFAAERQHFSDRAFVDLLYSIWEHLIRYILTQGREGTKPSIASRYWENSGWAVMRSEWDEKPFLEHAPTDRVVVLSPSLSAMIAKTGTSAEPNSNGSSAVWTDRPASFCEFV